MEDDPQRALDLALGIRPRDREVMASGRVPKRLWHRYVSKQPYEAWFLLAVVVLVALLNSTDQAPTALAVVALAASGIFGALAIRDRMRRHAISVRQLAGEIHTERTWHPSPDGGWELWADLVFASGERIPMFGGLGENRIEGPIRAFLMPYDGGHSVLLGIEILPGAHYRTEPPALGPPEGETGPMPAD